MPALRAPLSAVPFILVCTALAACRVATQQNDFHMSDDKVDSAQVIAAPEDAGGSPLDDRDQHAADAADASSDVEAAAPVAPPCGQLAMYGSAPSTACAADSIIVMGGTPGVGGYYLSRWADGEKSCSSASQRRGSMTIENVGGTLFMRWVLSIDGSTSWGTYELAPNTPTSFTRSEVCNWTPQTPARNVSFTATSDTIFFFHADGQERWTRIPKTVPTGAAPEPVGNL